MRTKIQYTFLILIGFISTCLAQTEKTSFFKLSDTSFEENDIYRTYNIKFQLAKWTFRPDSMFTLDSVAEFLLNNPKIKIGIEVHSDSRTSPKMSDSPYQKRAQEIADYLFNKGVNKERMVPKGWGERHLLISDQQINKAKTKEEKEKLHALNRRVEFKILSTDFKE